MFHAGSHTIARSGRNLCFRPIYPLEPDPLRFADKLYFNFLPHLSHFNSVFLPLLKPTAFHTIAISLLFVYLFNCFIMAVFILQTTNSSRRISRLTVKCDWYKNETHNLAVAAPIIYEESGY